MTTVPGTELVPYSEGYVYMWIDMSNGMMYIGSHNGKNSTYVGSGTYFNAAYAQRSSSFNRIVLYTGSYYRFVEETILISVDAANNSQYYNLTNFCAGAWLSNKPDAVANWKLSISDGQARANARPEVRARKKKAAQKVRKSHPTWAENQSKSQKLAYEREDRKERHLQSHRTDEYRALSRELQISKWKDEDFRAHCTKMQNKPEVKEKTSAPLIADARSDAGRVRRSKNMKQLNHNKYHIDRTVWNFDRCTLCVEDVTLGRRLPPDWCTSDDTRGTVKL